MARHPRAGASRAVRGRARRRSRRSASGRCADQTLVRSDETARRCATGRRLSPLDAQWLMDTAAARPQFVGWLCSSTLGVRHRQRRWPVSSVLRVPIRELRCAAAAVVLAGVATASCVRRSPEAQNSAAPTPASPAPLLAVRLAFKDPAAGRERARYGDTTVFLAPEVLLSDDDLLSVRP